MQLWSLAHCKHSPTAVYFIWYIKPHEYTTHAHIAFMFIEYWIRLSWCSFVGRNAALSDQQARNNALFAHADGRWGIFHLWWTLHLWLSPTQSAVQYIYARFRVYTLLFKHWFLNTRVNTHTLQQTH